MSDYRIGDVIDTATKGLRVTGEGYDEACGSAFLRVVTEVNGVEVKGLVWLDGPTTITLVAPAEWPPRPGDLWKDRSGDLWFGQGYRAEPGEPRDSDRTVLVSVSGGPCGIGSELPDDANRQYGPLTLVHREGTDR